MLRMVNYLSIRQKEKEKKTETRPAQGKNDGEEEMMKMMTNHHEVQYQP